MSDLFLFIIAGLTGGAIFVFILYLFPDQSEMEARRRLGVGGAERKTPSLVLRIVRPLFVLLVPLTAKVPVPQYREKVKRKFVSAGMDELTVDEFLAYKVIMGVFVPAFFFFSIKGLFNETIPVWGVLALTAFGFFFPDTWLNGRVQLRHKEILMALPYVMDLLTLSVEAGLDFVAGIGKVVEKSAASPLIDEFRLLLQEIQVGNTRQQALRNLAFRINMVEINSFVSLLVQADELGASIGPVLRAQSDLFRTQRFQRAEKAGAAAAQKILFPLVLCILPAVFIVIFGPIALSFLYGGGFAAKAGAG